jgi:putative SOS response-associated peptidase YedK
MCGRMVWVWDAKTGALVQRFDDGRRDPDAAALLATSRYNIPPTAPVPVLMQDAQATEAAAGAPAGGDRLPGDGVVSKVAHWGFPLHGKPVFNTRIEGAYESPLWRGLIGRHHALVPASGFYEWSGNKTRVPHYVTRADGEPMLLAAVVGQRDIGGAPQRCASIVTCAASPSLAPLHDRMPVILDEADAHDWLAPARAGPRILELSVPREVRYHAVGRDVNNAAHDGAHLIEPPAWF